MKRTLIAILLIAPMISYSQTDISYAPVINNMTFQHFLSRELFNNYNLRLKNIGHSGVCYIRFQVDTAGRPINIMVSPGTNDTLAIFLKECLLKTNGYWYVSKNRKPDTDEYIIQPVVYNLQKNGQTNAITTNPHALLAFLNPNMNSKPVKLVFLQKIEYTSPFE